MAWPPPTLPTTRTDTTVMASTHPADHNAVNLAINDIVGYVKPSVWTAVTYQNGWTTMSGGQPLQYRKTGDVVSVRGMVAGGASATVCTTLPAGYRPPASLATVGSSYQGGPNFAYIDISTNGGILLMFTAATSGIGILFDFSTIIT